MDTGQAKGGVTDTPIVGYGRRSGRRRAGRLALLLACAAVAGCAAWRWAIPQTRQALFLYRQQQCLEYEMPAERVVFASAPEEAARLTASSRWYRPPARPLFDERWPGWRAPAYFLPPPWASWGPTATTSQYRPDGLAYLHRRRTCGGDERLVTVRLGTGAYRRDGYKFVLRAKAYVPATWGVGSRLTYEMCNTNHGMRDMIVLDVATNDQVRVMAGQTDPNDEARFTIAYEINDKRGTVDGWLQDALPTQGTQVSPVSVVLVVRGEQERATESARRQGSPNGDE